MSSHRHPSFSASTKVRAKVEACAVRGDAMGRVYGNQDALGSQCLVVDFVAILFGGNLCLPV